MRLLWEPGATCGRGALETWLVQLRHRIFCIDKIEM